MSDADITAFILTIKLATLTTLALLVIGIPFAWWLARTSWRFKFIIEALVALPLVLPPTVLGFYLLVAMGNDGPIGEVLELLGFDALIFSFTGIVIGSMVYSLPFVIQPLQQAFAAISQLKLDAAATLGASPLDRFFSIVLPLSRGGLLTAAVLGFAHTLGEFGVVLMIGGNIPGETQVVSIAIYDHVESLAYRQAHLLSASLLLLSFVLLMAIYGINRRYRGVSV